MPQETRVMTNIPGDFRSLMDVCLDLHMWNNGSGDPWATNRQECLLILQTALEYWTEGTNSAKEFDDAVKNLIQVTLDEDTWFDNWRNTH